MAEQPTTRAEEIQHTIDRLNQFADDWLTQVHQEVAIIRSLADGLARREHERMPAESSAPEEFEEGGCFGGVTG